MALVKAFSRVDGYGKVRLPSNIQREAGLREGQLIELKIVGSAKKKNILLSARDSKSPHPPLCKRGVVRRSLPPLTRGTRRHFPLLIRGVRRSSPL
jgi:bifunctional DNA-binding transcriptional regulator/antitoxin component of YhaV-PrlF toxin-antitoxin module